jgi:hypothetical protein
VIASLTDQELGHVLAALRLHQRQIYRSADLEDIATDGGNYAPMSPREIDDLCERLNLRQVFGEAVRVTTIHHRHGTDVLVNRTEVGAVADLAKYCRDNWDDEHVKLGRIPKTDEKVTEKYFKVWADALEPEWYETESRELGR